MRFYFFDHQGKETALVAALLSAGWQKQRIPKAADIIFSDVDVSVYVKNLKIFSEQGKRIFIYPHAAMPNVFGDFEKYVPFEKSLAHFVIAPGHAEVMRTWGYTLPIEIIGWYFCKLLPFKPRPKIRKVLFAPIHPNADNSLSPVEKDINAKAYRKLLALVDAGSIELTVRYLRGLENNGLWNYPNVAYVIGSPDQSTKEIDAADIVVSKKTMQYMAVARGVPTVGMGEDIPPPMGSPDRNNYAVVQSWDKYKNIMMYPHDILQDADTLNLFRAVAAGDPYTADWRKRMVGHPFDAQAFVAMVNKYL